MGDDDIVGDGNTPAGHADTPAKVEIHGVQAIGLVETMHAIE